jgi:hypothetical protein
MSLFRNVLLACWSLLLWAGPISADVLHVVGGSDVKPPDPGFVYNRSVFDCTPLLTLPLNIGLTGSLVDDTTGGTNLINSYPCAPWQEMGPEHIYRLDVAAGDTLQFWAGLRNVDPDIDHDIFLLNGCDTDSCLIGANTELTANLTGGSYYLIIDGAGSGSNFAEGLYTLDISARYIGVPPSICDPGGAIEVDTGQAVLEFPGNLFGQDNLIQSYECSPILLRGGEIWYTLTLPPPVDNQFGGLDFAEFRVEFPSVTFPLDIALWLFDGCGTSPTCLDYVNDATGGRGETMTYRNETEQEITVYLGVDCFRAPTESGLGFFTIKFTNDVVVPTEKTSLGSLRALYR